jgi:UDP-N-acetylglucosamine enolpyruvyl transferase
MMALLTTIEGASVIQDTVYNDRFTHIAELQRLGQTFNNREHRLYPRWKALI